jgi:hypothetical protein
MWRSDAFPATNRSRFARINRATRHDVFSTMRASPPRSNWLLTRIDLDFARAFRPTSFVNRMTPGPIAASAGSNAPPAGAGLATLLSLGRGARRRSRSRDLSSELMSYLCLVVWESSSRGCKLTKLREPARENRGCIVNVGESRDMSRPSIPAWQDHWKRTLVP